MVDTDLDVSHLIGRDGLLDQSDDSHLGRCQTRELFILYQLRYTRAGCVFTCHFLVLNLDTIEWLRQEHLYKRTLMKTYRQTPFHCSKYAYYHDYIVKFGSLHVYRNKKLERVESCIWASPIILLK